MDDDACRMAAHRRRPHLADVNDFGYQSCARDAANVLYRVVNDGYLKGRPTVVITTQPLAALGQLFHDEGLAEAILDRILERATHCVLRGRSYRTRHLEEAHDAEPEAALPISLGRGEINAQTTHCHSRFHFRARHRVCLRSSRLPGRRA